MPILAQNALLSGLIVYSLRLQAHQLETQYRAAGLAEAAFAEQQETQYREADEGYVTSTFPAHTAFTATGIVSPSLLSYTCVHTQTYLVCGMRRYDDDLTVDDDPPVAYAPPPPPTMGSGVLFASNYEEVVAAIYVEAADFQEEANGGTDEYVIGCRHSASRLIEAARIRVGLQARPDKPDVKTSKGRRLLSCLVCGVADSNA